MLIITLLLIVSLIVNVLLVWYTRKVIQNLTLGVNNIDELQKLLNEYSDLLEPLSQMENYYNDPAITSTIANTKMVAAACKSFRNTIIESPNEENQEEYQAAEESPKEENGQRTTKAVIGSI